MQILVLVKLGYVFEQQRRHAFPPHQSYASNALKALGMHLVSASQSQPIRNKRRLMLLECLRGSNLRGSELMEGSSNFHVYLYNALVGD